MLKNLWMKNKAWKLKKNLMLELWQQTLSLYLLGKKRVLDSFNGLELSEKQKCHEVEST